MRVKTFVLGLVCLFMSSFLFCLQIDFSKFSPEDCAKYIEKKLKYMDYDFQVTTELKEGKINFLFNLEKEVKNIDDVEDFTMDIVVLVGEITKKTSWRSDKVIVLFKNKPFFWIYTKDCREAISEAHDLDRMEFITTRLHYFK